MENRSEEAGFDMIKTACELRKDVFVEAAEQTVDEKKKIALLVLLGIFAIGAVILLIFDHSAAAWALLLVCLALAACCAYVRFLAPSRRAKALYKQMTEVCPQESYSLYMEFGEESVLCRTPTNGTLKIEYKKIRSLFNTENLFVLVTKQGLRLPINKSKLSAADRSDLLLLLQDGNKRLKMFGFETDTE